jgi:hypothetical protein
MSLRVVDRTLKREQLDQLIPKADLPLLLRMLKPDQRFVTKDHKEGAPEVRMRIVSVDPAGLKHLEQCAKLVEDEEFEDHAVGTVFEALYADGVSDWEHTFIFPLKDLASARQQDDGTWVLLLEGGPATLTWHGE